MTSSHSGSKFENTLDHHKHCDKNISLQHCVCYGENLGLEECDPCHWENSPVGIIVLCFSSGETNMCSISVYRE